MSGKGGKGLVAAKTAAAGKDKDKKLPVSRSSRAGLQVAPHSRLLILARLSCDKGSFLELGIDAAHAVYVLLCCACVWCFVQSA